MPNKTRGPRKTPAEKAIVAALAAYRAADPDLAAITKEWDASCKANSMLLVTGRATTPVEKKAAAAHEALRVRWLTAEATALRAIATEAARLHNNNVANGAEAQ